MYGHQGISHYGPQQGVYSVGGGNSWSQTNSLGYASEPSIFGCGYAQKSSGALQVGYKMDQLEQQWQRQKVVDGCKTVAGKTANTVIGTVGGAAVGAAAGAAIAACFGGVTAPVGAVIGAVVGGVAGGCAGIFVDK